VRCGRGLGIAEDVVDQRHQGAESLGGSLEHMFVKVRRGADGTGGLQGILQSGLEASRDGARSVSGAQGEPGRGGFRRRVRTRRPAWCGCARRPPW
jgi:hypothetical protein